MDDRVIEAACPDRSMVPVELREKQLGFPVSTYSVPLLNGLWVVLCGWLRRSVSVAASLPSSSKLRMPSFSFGAKRRHKNTLPTAVYLWESLLTRPIPLTIG